MMMCHMVSENLESLHAMADNIGISRLYFQRKPMPHYDICKAKRKKALMLGAIALSRHDFVEVIRRIRSSHESHS